MLLLQHFPASRGAAVDGTLCMVALCRSLVSVCLPLHATFREERAGICWQVRTRCSAVVAAAALA
jgi:hypothetical protein